LICDHICCTLKPRELKCNFCDINLVDIILAADHRTASDASHEKTKYAAAINWLVSQWTVTPNELNVLCKYKQWDTLLLACVSAAQQQHKQQQQQNTAVQSQSATQPAATTHNIIVSAISDVVQASIATNNMQELSSALGALWYVLQLHSSSAAQHLKQNDSTDVSPESTFLAIVNDIMGQHITYASSSSSQSSNNNNNCTYGSVQDFVSQAIVTAVGKSVAIRATATAAVAVDAAMIAVVNTSDHSHVQR
jgi:hypothetical protein